MDFPEPDNTTEEEEIDEILRNIRDGCCLGEGSETGAPSSSQVSFYRFSDGTRCFDAPKELIDRLLNEKQLTYKEEPYPERPDFRRRVYDLTERKDSL